MANGNIAGSLMLPLRKSFPRLGLAVCALCTLIGVFDA